MVFDGRRFGTWLKTTSLNKTAKNRLLLRLSSLFSTIPYLNDSPPANDHGWAGKIIKRVSFRRYFAMLWTKPRIVGDTLLSSKVVCIP